METTAINFKFKTIQVKDWEGNLNTFFKAVVGNTTYSCLSLESLKEKVENHKELNQDGAEDWYGKGMYNGD